MDNRLFRSRADAKLGGICGGLAAFVRIDPTLVRVFFILLALANGIGILIYLMLWFVVPVEGQDVSASATSMQATAQEIAEKARGFAEDVRNTAQGQGRQAAQLIGLGLVVLGAVFLLQNLGIYWLRWIRFDVLWPLILIAAGLALLYRRVRGE